MVTWFGIVCAGWLQSRSNAMIVTYLSMGRVCLWWREPVPGDIIRRTRISPWQSFPADSIWWPSFPFNLNFPFEHFFFVLSDDDDFRWALPLVENDSTCPGSISLFIRLRTAHLNFDVVDPKKRFPFYLRFSIWIFSFGSQFQFQSNLLQSLFH